MTTARPSPISQGVAKPLFMRPLEGVQKVVTEGLYGQLRGE